MLTAGGVFGTTAAANAAPHPTRLPHSAPRWIAGAHPVGRPSTSHRLDLRVYLAPRGGLGALESEVSELNDPANAKYHRFLTAAQYHETFDPSAGARAAVARYLRSSGLTVSDAASNSHWIAASGTVAQIDAAFSTTLRTWDHDGHRVTAPDQDLALPTSTASAVTAVTGLDTSPVGAQPASATPAPPPPGHRNTTYCSTYYGQRRALTKVDGRTPLPAFEGDRVPYHVCGYVGSQLRKAYEGSTSLNGRGVVVGVLSAFLPATLRSDLNTYAVRSGDGAYRSGQLQITAPSSYRHLADTTCMANDWYSEESMDVEAVHAMAPGANIHLYAARSCAGEDFNAGLFQIADADDVDIVTNSWGGFELQQPESELLATHQAILQGGAEGISYVASSGDWGDNTVVGAPGQAFYPASDPDVTAVGGTAAAISKTGGLRETGWGSYEYQLSADGRSWTSPQFDSGSGGGPSNGWEKPSYQSALPGSKRLYPDVAMDGDPSTGFRIGLTQRFPTGDAYGEFAEAGTSLSSPLFAGMTALAIQHAGHRAGLLNRLIYAKGASLFTDIVAPLQDPAVENTYFLNHLDPSGGYGYLLYTFDQDSPSLRIAKGWDPVTGFGSPKTSWLTALG